LTTAREKKSFTHLKKATMNKGEKFDVHLLDGTVLQGLTLERIADYYLLWEGDIMTLYREINFIKEI
jgi:hypothetical protein